MATDIYNTDNLKDTMYQTQNLVFIPTVKVVTQEYENGEIGNQLWMCMKNGFITGTFYTEKEILQFNPSIITFKT